MPDYPAYYKPTPNTHTRNNSLSSAVTPTLPTYGYLLIQALGANVRYTMDGTTPTAAVGFQLKAGDPPVLIALGTGMTFRMIQEAASAEVQYEVLG